MASYCPVSIENYPCLAPILCTGCDRRLDIEVDYGPEILVIVAIESIQRFNDPSTVLYSLAASLKRKKSQDNVGCKIHLANQALM